MTVSVEVVSPVSPPVVPRQPAVPPRVVRHGEPLGVLGEPDCAHAQTVTLSLRALNYLSLSAEGPPPSESHSRTSTGPPVRARRGGSS